MFTPGRADFLNQSNMERADIRQKQIDELNAWWEMQTQWEIEQELRNGIVEEEGVFVVDGFNISGTEGLLIQAA